MKPTPGIRRLHSAKCPARSNGRCACGAGWEAYVYDSANDRKIRKTFPTLAAARSWRADAESGVRRGTLRAASPVTVEDAARELFAAMRSGAARTRSGDSYKPSAVMAYEAAFDLYLLDDLGAMRIGDVKRRHVQRLADSLVADGKSPSTVRNALMPLRVIFRRAIRDEIATVNPCTGIELPANRSARPTIAPPEEAAKLVAALPTAYDRALWSTALYAGLRRGELMALRWRDVDLANGTLHVERAYDPKAGEFVAPKSRSGRRRVPVAGVLRDALDAHRVTLDAEPDPDALVFSVHGRPFEDEPVRRHARTTWEKAKLEPIGLHAARHTAASLMIASGVNVKALSTFLGHASITITLDRYGHLLPGSISEATTLLDAFLARTGEPTGEQLEESLQISDS